MCGGLAGAEAQSVSAIIEAMESKVCTEASTGYPLPYCKTIAEFLKGTGTGFTWVNEFCPDVLGLFVGCKGSNAKAYTENEKRDDCIQHSEDYNCDSPKEKSIETTVD